MNLSGNQRRLYALAAVLLVLTVCLCGAWSLWQRPSGQGTSPTPSPTIVPAVGEEATPPPEGANTTQQSDAVNLKGNTVNTVVYYQDNYGYLVPVMRAVPSEDGIAKATLNLMVQSPYNDMEAARLGLRTIFPENTKMSLDIVDGVAKIDLGTQVMKMKDAQAEVNMVTAVVQALTEFPTVKSVQFTINGEKVDQLKHGTSIAGEFKRSSLNLESASADMNPAEAQTVKLYFPGESNSLIVPVTRMVYGANDINTAVLELTKGPSASSPLDTALPSGCGLIGVTVQDGKAVINFTREFMNIAEETDGGRMALKALVLTCTQFEGVKGVEIQVEGQHYDPGTSTLNIPTFINEASAIHEEVIRTQAAMILDLD